MNKNLIKKYETAAEIINISAFAVVFIGFVCLFSSFVVWSPGTPSPLSQKLLFYFLYLFFVGGLVFFIGDHIGDRAEKMRDDTRRAEWSKKYNNVY